MATRVRSTGVPTTPGPDGSVPIRREIRDLQINHPEQFNLYILGLVQLQKTPPSETLSYYQLAGIHGQPYVPWNEVGGNRSSKGYCTHSSILFLTWHRPYLATFEQALYTIIQKIANEFPANLRSTYVAAAKDFRMPYWDWAQEITGDGRNQISAFPTALGLRKIPVILSSGKPDDIDNPLYKFQFDYKNIPKELNVLGDWAKHANTVRQPRRKGSDESNDKLVGDNIKNEAASLRAGVLQVLLGYKNFETVSTDVYTPGPGGYASLEGFHNSIHGYIGGEEGHMGSQDVSAFDPVFWLHHANVDRQWAIWQALNPNSYGINRETLITNFTIAARTRVTEKTDLKPFYDATGAKFWTSETVKWTTPLGYAYPETQPWLYKDEKEYRKELERAVSVQYDGNPFTTFKAPRKATALAGRVQAESADGNIQAAAFEPEQRQHFEVKEALQHPIQAAKQIFQHKEPQNNPEENNPTEVNTTGTRPSDIPPEFAHLVHKDGTYTHWITNLRASKHGLSQTFTVKVFLGDFNEDPHSWTTEYNVVGSFTVLGKGEDTQCEKCRGQQDDELVITGVVPLTSALLQDIVEGELASLEPEDVVPHLEKHLHWRVTLFDGTEQPRDQVPGLKVGVVSTSVRLSERGVPVFSREYTAHPSVTDGRPAGLSNDDDL